MTDPVTILASGTKTSDVNLTSIWLRKREIPLTGSGIETWSRPNRVLERFRTRAVNKKKKEKMYILRVYL